MRVFSNDLPIVICNTVHRETVENLAPSFSHSQVYHDVSLIELKDSKDIQSILASTEVKFSSIKILDRFYLLLSNIEDVDTRTIVSFFDVISKDYNSLIDIKKNTSNISRLITRLLEFTHKNPNPTILDFGCGIGLSSKVKSKFETKSRNINLIGFDLSAKMINLGKKAGLKTINLNGLNKIKDNSLDGIFSSYVMHFIRDYSIIKLIWSKLKFEGAFIANFHKNIGLENVLSIIKGLKGTVKLIEEGEFGSVYLFQKNHELVIECDRISEYFFQNYSKQLDKSVVQKLIDNNIITQFEYNGVSYVSRFDIDSISSFLGDIKIADSMPSDRELYSNQYFINTSNLSIEFKNSDDTDLDPFSISFLKNLFSQYDPSSDSEDVYSIVINTAISLKSKNKIASDYIKSHLKLKDKIESSRVSIFSKSASYMGSKKSLRSFIIESVYNQIKPNSQALDLMCGSGAISGALSQFCETYTSDALKFCRTLAKAQGGGFDIEKANNIIDSIRKDVDENLSELKKHFSFELATEDRIFHSEINKDLILEYSQFCLDHPKTNEKGSAHALLYNSRITNNSAFPYVLFSCAYSNLYLGFRQSIELDSYKYGIDKLKNKTHREWANGALIATLSAVGNTYAGHFAQPKYKNIVSLSNTELFHLFEQRTISIGNEFEVRLREFAFESASNKSSVIHEISGPWQNSLIDFEKEVRDRKNAIVYVDAPYTRDEYSRYYHLLETLVNYDYPEFSGVGRVPNKRNGNRFNSDFFTKTANKLKSVYVDLILNVLQREFKCAWSYSDNATIPIFEIINEVYNQSNCKIICYSTPYKHQAHGGKKAKKTREFLILFLPEGKRTN